MKATVSDSGDDELAHLQAAIDRIDRISNEEWQRTLSDRKIRELEFHDRDRATARIEASKANDTYERFYGNKKYYQATQRSTDFVDGWIAQNAPGNVFLDYACGNGGQAIKASRAGARLSLGFDISGVSVSNARARARAEGSNIAERTRFFQADAENTQLPANSVDRVMCSGMLHHLDLSHAFPELRRILKPGGKVLAIEALDYNPAIKLYRKLTPDMRTEWEKAHILDLGDIAFASRFFEITDVRYWHVLGYAGGKFPFLMPLLDRIDSVLERTPFVQRMAWIFTFELTKPSE